MNLFEIVMDRSIQALVKNPGKVAASALVFSVLGVSYGVYQHEKSQWMEVGIMNEQVVQTFQKINPYQAQGWFQQQSERLEDVKKQWGQMRTTFKENQDFIEVFEFRKDWDEKKTALEQAIENADQKISKAPTQWDQNKAYAEKVDQQFKKNVNMNFGEYCLWKWNKMTGNQEPLTSAQVIWEGNQERFGLDPEGFKNQWRNMQKQNQWILQKTTDPAVEGIEARVDDVQGFYEKMMAYKEMVDKTLTMIKERPDLAQISLDQTQKELIEGYEKEKKQALQQWDNEKMELSSKKDRKEIEDEDWNEFNQQYVQATDLIRSWYDQLQEQVKEDYSRMKMMAANGSGEMNQENGASVNLAPSWSSSNGATAALAADPAASSAAVPASNSYAGYHHGHYSPSQYLLYQWLQGSSRPFYYPNASASTFSAGSASTTKASFAGHSNDIQGNVRKNPRPMMDSAALQSWNHQKLQSMYNSENEHSHVFQKMQSKPKYVALKAKLQSLKGSDGGIKLHQIKNSAKFSSSKIQQKASSRISQRSSTSNSGSRSLSGRSGGRSFGG